MRRPTRLLAMALLLAGCSAHASPNSPGSAADLTPTEQVESLRLPFDAYSFSLAEMYTIANAEDVLVDECMRAKGLDWQIIKRPTVLQDLRNRRRYGVIEIRGAQQFGYHVPAGLLTPVEVEEQYDARDNSLSKEQEQAAHTEGGCGHEAAKRLRPAQSPGPGRLQQLDRESLYDKSRAEPGVAAALNSWRECMRQKGFDYADPFAAMSDSRWWAEESAGPSGQEVAVAVADVQCKEQAALVEAWQAAETRIQTGAIAEHADYFASLKAAMEHELTAARMVIARQ